MLACLSAPAFSGLECGHCSFLRCAFFCELRLRFFDTHIDFRRRFLPHLVRDMGVGVQCSGAGHMAQDGRQSLDVHSVCQSVGGECVSEVMKSDIR